MEEKLYLKIHMLEEERKDKNKHIKTMEIV